MALSVRGILAYLRGRWHAGLEFKAAQRQRMLLERLTQLEAALDPAASCERHEATLAQVEQALTLLHAMHEGRIREVQRLVEQQAARCEESSRLQAEQLGRALQAAAQQRHAALTAGLDALQSELLRAAQANQQEALREVRAASATPALERHEQAIASALDRMMTRFTQRLDALDSRLERLAAAPAVDTLPVPTLQAEVEPQYDPRRLERQGLFVVGCCRSGTTILCETLNLARDVHLLEEAFLYRIECDHPAGGPPDFVEMFNARHVHYGNIKAKGSYAPQRGAAGRHFLEYLDALAEDYRYVGEKIAFGPGMIEDAENAFLAFQSRHFFQSHYVAIVRRPAEAVWSMTKMFPQVPVASLVEVWIRSLRVVLELYLAFPRVRLMFLEDFHMSTIDTLANWLGVAIQPPESLIDIGQQSSRLDEGQVPERLRPCQMILEGCASVYAALHGVFCPPEMVYRGPGLPTTYCREQRERLTQLLQMLPHVGANSQAA